MNATTVYISHADCALHSMGALHPESPDRLTAIGDQMIASGLDALLAQYDAPAATDEQLALAHSPLYVAELATLAPHSGIRHLDPDTAMCPDTLRAARRAAGAGILATDMVLDGGARNAFCAVRPPGHHAERMQAMGFCFFNNVAIAARHALEVRGLERVAIVDFDVHHGNGTEQIFANDPRVLMVGFFQSPLYPYSGTEPAGPNILNTPLPAATGGKAVRELLTSTWLPALVAHAPQMIFVSAGFDAHREDDMASMALVEADYAWITEQLSAFADAHCGGRIVSMLEGGYDLSALGRSVVAHVRALIG
ncbi:MAG: histone deacetylase family protein [Rhodocyclaceae bacterium]|jgi:acetoin utilization deacetylase AcuC-like enzyme